MRSCFAVLLAVAAVTLVAPAVRAERSFQIIPQAGLTAAALASEPESLTSTAKIGYMLGGSLRFGSRFFVQPGVFYQRTAVTAQSVEDISSITFDDDLGVSSLWIPVQVGVNVIHRDLLDLHLSGGPTATFVTSVSDNDLGLTKDDYESVVWGAVVGVGTDITAVSLDASYEFGLSKVLKTEGSDTKQNVFRFTVGLRF
jgi:hypothetical protein